MKKALLFKKTAALLLAFCLALGCMSVCVYAEDSQKSQYHPERLITGSFGDLSIADADDVQVPTIIIPGMTLSDFYLYDENGELKLDSEGNVMRSGFLITDSAEVSTALKGMIKPLLKSVICQSDKELSESVYNLVSNLFKYQTSKPDGTGVYDVRVKTFDHSLAQMTQEDKDYYLNMFPLHSYCRIFGEEYLYVYTYYMYGNVIEQGEALQDYIDMVQEQNNGSKVNILTMSMGTTILNTWLDSDKADYSDVNRIIDAVPLYAGCDIITDVLARDFHLEDEFIYQEYMPIITKGFLENEYLGYLLNVLIKLLPQETFERVLTRLADAFIDTIKNSSQIWSMVTPSSYEKLADKYFSTPEYATLRGITGKYCQAQRNLSDNLNTFVNDYGGKVFTICGYGLDYTVNKFSMMSIVGHNSVANSDCLIDVRYSSLGATCANKGETLSEEYINGLKNKNYLSPDKRVDASTCQFPDTTWFFMNQSHWAYENDIMLNTVWLIMAGIIDDIYSSVKYYPQFNGTRNTYDATLTLMVTAEKILADPTKYDEKLVAELQTAFDEMRKIYNTTDLKYDTATSDAKAAAVKLRNVLSTLGACDPAPDDGAPKWGEFAKSLSKLVYKIYGPRGYFDWMNVRNLFN